MMIVRNILDLGPKARIYDVPLLPPPIGQTSLFASTASAAYLAIEEMIRRQSADGAAAERWVVVNAWAIFDRSTESSSSL